MRLFHKEPSITVKRIDPGDEVSFKEALALAWKTFLKFDAPDYSEVGIENFKRFIDDATLIKMFNAGEYLVYGAYMGDKLTGMVSLRNINHISLLFVDEKYHRHGIGRSLMNAARTVEKAMGNGSLTVNSSPYAVGFYHRIGFVDTDIARTNEGIMYTSMTWEFED